MDRVRERRPERSEIEVAAESTGIWCHRMLPRPKGGRDRAAFCVEEKAARAAAACVEAQQNTTASCSHLPGVEPDWERTRGAEDHPTDMNIASRGIQSQVRQAIQDRLKDDPSLHERKVHSQARVGTAREREVLLSRPEDVETLWVFVARIVVVGGAEVDVHQRSRRKLRARDFGLACGDPHDPSERTLPSQPFVDRLGDERAVLAKRLELRRVCQQGEEQVAGGAVRRLRASGREKPQEGEDVVVAELRTINLSVGQYTGKVVTRLLSAVGQNLREQIA